MAVLLDLVGVSRVYALDHIEVRALESVSLAIEVGEFVAVMGASGSGKSTLMNIMGCLDRPTSGSYRLDGQEVSTLGRNELADLRSIHLGFVFQGFNLLSRTSALENVELPLVYTRCRPTERHRRAREALERVGLADRLRHHPGQLSGGQQQRVAIARALVNRPRVVLADEPTGNLDSRTSLDVMVLLQDLNREGLTLVLVTHEPDIAAFASRVITMRDGRVLADRRQAPVDARLSLVSAESAGASPESRREA
jgi:putative ABC transport system ATP-binding protein